jgi:hypothetical protein
MSYTEKYLKYKLKYKNLKNLIGGGGGDDDNIFASPDKLEKGVKIIIEFIKNYPEKKIILKLKYQKLFIVYWIQIRHDGIYALYAQELYSYEKEKTDTNKICIVLPNANKSDSLSIFIDNVHRDSAIFFPQELYSAIIGQEKKLIKKIFEYEEQQKMYINQIYLHVMDEIKKKNK